MIDEMPVFGTHQDNTIEQLTDVAARADRVALMADGHLGYIMPVGGVAAYRNLASVAGVGFDIACGNAAIQTNLEYADIAKRRMELADVIWNTVSFGIGRNNESDDAPTDDPLFEDPAWDAIPGTHERDKLKARARNQLGTVGSGNHYVDVFADEKGLVWVGVHFGSRGFGWNVAMGFMALSQNEPWGKRVREAEALLDLDSPMGDAYWQLMTLAGRYAYVGREWVVRKVVELLGGEEVQLIHNHHNFAWKEEHLNLLTGEHEEFVVVRKGATPAFPGQRGFVGGSMGDDAVIVEGSSDMRALETQQMALFSPTLDENVGEDHPVRVIDEVLASMEWTEWEAHFPFRVGQPPIHPRKPTQSRPVRVRRPREYAARNRRFVFSAVVRKSAWRPSCCR